MLYEIYFKFHRYLALRFKFPELFLKNSYIMKQMTVQIYLFMRNLSCHKKYLCNGQQERIGCSAHILHQPL